MSDRPTSSAAPKTPPDGLLRGRASPASEGDVVQGQHHYSVGTTRLAGHHLLPHTIRWCAGRLITAYS